MHKITKDKSVDHELPGIADDNLVSASCHGIELGEDTTEHNDFGLHSTAPATKCESSEQYFEVQINNNIKDEVSEATEDESMAVEALWQLGGGYNEKEDLLKETQTDNSESDLAMRYPVIKSAYRLLQCENCTISFSTDSELNLHLPTCEGPIGNILTCNICSVTFDTKTNFHNHMVCHEVTRPYSCRPCGSLFKQKNELHNHICQQSLRNLQCNICGIEFTRASSLSNHLKVHSYTPGRAIEASPMVADTGLLEPAYSNSWSTEGQTLPPLLPQLDMQPTNYYNQSSSDMSSWNLGLPDSLTSEDLPDSMDIAQEMTINTTYINVLDTQPSSFPNEFDELNTSGGSLRYDSQTPDDDKIPCGQMNQDNLSQKSPNDSVKVESLLYPICTLSPNHDNKLQDNSTSKKKPHSCKFCGVSFTRAKALLSHERLHQDYISDFYECNKCGDVFPDSIRHKNHICKIDEKKAKVTKPLLNKMIPSLLMSGAQILPSEALSELGNEYIETENFDDKSTLLINPKKLNKHACRHCSKRFTTKQKMFRHMWIHREKTFSCEICGETFSLQNELDTHRLSSHPSSTPHNCAVCGKCFASRQGLWEHARSHRQGAASHSCNLCGKSFSSRQGFLIHTRTHTGERPYGCRYCWKAFRDGGTLRKHERIHTGERPHVCPLCWRAFNQKVVLREHVRWVHAAPGPAAPPFPCPLCSQMLPDKEDLCAHIVKHSDTNAAIDKQKHFSTPEGSSSPPKLTIKKDLFECNASVLELRSELIMNSIPHGAESPEKSTEEESNHMCDMCSDVFSSRELLLTHVRVHI